MLPALDAVVVDGQVPIVSLADIDDPEHRPDLARKVGDALRRYGFYVAIDHDVPRVLFDQLADRALEFFHQSREKRSAVGAVIADRAQRGWTSAQRAAAGIDVRTEVDLGESWAMNPFDEALGWRDLTSLGPVFRRAFVHPNLFPRISGFHRYAVAYFTVMQAQLRTLMSLHAIDLGLPSDCFARMLRDGLDNLVVNFYPKLERPPKPNQFRRGPHTDLGVITGLMHTGQQGLQVADPTDPNRWIAVPSRSDGIVVNAGDLLAFISGGAYRSALHRVVCIPGVERLSIPVFVQPSPQATVTPAVTSGDTPQQQPVLFGDYFARRIGVMYDDERPSP